MAIRPNWLPSDSNDSDDDEFKTETTEKHSCNGTCCHCRDDPDGKYPRDCFSFIAQGDASSLPFWYGWMVAFFELSFILLIILSKAYRPMSANEDVDNPNKFAQNATYANWLPANSTGIVRITQIFAVFAIVLFSDESLNDLSSAVRFFPGAEYPASREKENNLFWARIAAVVKGVQGFFACSCVILLVMTSDDVIDIILNFAAVNFISAFDDVAFDIAKDGKYGDTLREAAEYIEERKLTDCRKGPWRRKIGWIVPKKKKRTRTELDDDEEFELHQESEPEPESESDEEEIENNWIFQSHLISAFTVGVVLFTISIGIVTTQVSDAEWTTHMFRIQFDEESGLQDQSGCYQYTGDSNDGRQMYRGFHKEETSTTVLAYCKRDRRWIFFESDGGEIDPCIIDIKSELAHSEKTNSFDISTSFESSWLSPYNKPLDVYFIDNPNNNDTAKFFHCESFANDGSCNEELNIFDYEYDGGDCCATTCTHPDCMAVDLETAFGQTVDPGLEAKGFPNCKNEDLVTLTIALSEMRKELPEWANDTYIDFENFWDTPVVILTCDPGERMVLSIPVNEMMMGQNMTAKVEVESVCTIVMKHFRPRVSIDVTVDGDDDLETKVVVKPQPSYAIPSQIGLFKELIELDLGNEALTGTIPTEIGFLNLLEKINLSQNQLIGTIPSSIGLLENMRNMELGSNRIQGFIPSEIGELRGMTYLDLSNNTLTGSIPYEIELLEDLRYLDLSMNPSLCGSVDCTKFKKMNQNAQEICFSLNTFRSCITEAPSVSTMPSGKPSESFLPSLSFAPTESQRPTLMTDSPSEMPLAFGETRSPSSAPTESPSSLPTGSPSSSPSPGCYDIVDLICNRDGFNKFCNFLTNAALPSNYTLFAAPDTGFDIVADLLAQISEEELYSVYLFHITEGILGVDDLECRGTLEMISGGSTRTLCNNQSPWTQFGTVNRRNNLLPEIVEADVEACDGLIHFMSNVLLPRSVPIASDTDDDDDETF